MNTFALFIAALWRKWWALMSCAVFTLLSLWVAMENKSNAWVVSGIATLAVIFFLVASFGAWSEEHSKLVLTERKLYELSPEFDFLVGTMLWKYDEVNGRSLFFPLARILNRGHASITNSWEATYNISGTTEKMVPLWLRGPYRIEIGHEELTLENSDLLSAKTAEKSIERGSVASGRLLFTLPGNRTQQIQSLQYTMIFTCEDYLGTKYTAIYKPSSEPVAGLITFPHERAVFKPPESIPPNPLLPPKRDESGV
jgi:hypothetical protein